MIWPLFRGALPLIRDRPLRHPPSLCLRLPFAAVLFSRAHSLLLAWVLTSTPLSAWAAAGESSVDRVADILALIVIVVVPVAGIYLFWQLHILPEKIAEKRNHPQKDAIRALCILSLIFGGMLWPIAWIWAYTKPTIHKLAYGTEEATDQEEPASEEREALRPEDRQVALHDQIDRLRREVDHLSHEGATPGEVESLKRDLARIEDKLTSRPGVH